MCHGTLVPNQKLNILNHSEDQVPALVDWTTPSWMEQFFCQNGIASTQKTDQSALRKISYFCSIFDIISTFPVSESALCVLLRITALITTHSILSWHQTCRQLWVYRSQKNSPPCQDSYLFKHQKSLRPQYISGDKN